MPFSHGGNVYDGEGILQNWIDVSANINPLGLSGRVKEAIITAVDMLVHYPDPEARALKNALAHHYEILKERLICTNGAAELMYIYFHTFKPKEVIIPVPSFDEYEKAAKAGGAHITYVYTQQDNFNSNLMRMVEAAGEEAVIILGNPNNPTGSLVRKEEVEAAVKEGIKKNLRFVVDESFLDFRYDEERFSVKKLTGIYENLLVIRSLTKFFALPGLRLGFGTACEPDIKKMEGHKDCWNVNSLAQVAGTAALTDGEYIRESRRLCEVERVYMKTRLQEITEIHVTGGSVNFILIQFLLPYHTAKEAADYFKCHGILIRNCCNYRGLNGEFIRLAVRDRVTNNRVIRIIKNYINNEKM